MKKNYFFTISFSEVNDKLEYNGGKRIDINGYLDKKDISYPMLIHFFLEAVDKLAKKMKISKPNLLD